VDSGRVDRHPIKRLRTTSTYLAIAILGTDDERMALRDEIDRVHAVVHSDPSDAVAYDAFDPALQLWVAACLYQGAEDVYTRLFGTQDADVLDRILYPHARTLATTLQV